MISGFTKEIGAVTTGHRTIMGTDWPVTNILEVIRSPRGDGKIVGYRVTFALCNGIPSHYADFRDRRAAEKAAGV